MPLDDVLVEDVLVEEFVVDVPVEEVLDVVPVPLVLVLLVMPWPPEVELVADALESGVVTSAVQPARTSASSPNFH